MKKIATAIAAGALSLALLTGCGGPIDTPAGSVDTQYGETQQFEVVKLIYDKTWLVYDRDTKCEYIMSKHTGYGGYVSWSFCPYYGADGEIKIHGGK